MNFTHFLKWKRFKARLYIKYVKWYIRLPKSDKLLANQFETLSISDCFEKGDYYRSFGLYDIARICYEIGIWKKHDISWSVRYYHSIGVIECSQNNYLLAQTNFNLALLVSDNRLNNLPDSLMMYLEETLLNLGLDDKAKLIRGGDIKNYLKVAFRA